METTGELVIEQAHYTIHHNGRRHLAIAVAPDPEDAFIMDVFRFVPSTELDLDYIALLPDEAELGGMYQAIRIGGQRRPYPALADCLTQLHERLNQDDAGQPDRLFWRRSAPPDDAYTISATTVMLLRQNTPFM